MLRQCCATMRLQPLLLILLLLLGLHGAHSFVASPPPPHTRLPALYSAPAPSIDGDGPDPSHPDPEAGFRRLLNLPLPKGPRPLPVFGNVFSLLWRAGNFDRYDAWVRRKYGDIALSRLLGACRAGVFDLEANQEPSINNRPIRFDPPTNQPTNQ